MKKIYMFALGTLLSVGLFAQNRSVTIRVDMTGQTVGASGVHVAGSFQNPQWQPNTTTMTQVGTTNIYTATVQIPDGFYEMKFINGNAWSGAEGVPSESQVGGGNDNRFMQITKDTTLAAVPFAGNNPAGKRLMRFKVDMALQTVSGNGVHVAGNFQASAGFGSDWQPNLTRLYNVNSSRPSLLERIVYVDSANYEYKFLNGNDWPDSESVPSACQVGGGNSNRQVLVGAATIVPEVCYGMCVACPTAPIPQYSFTIRVDMQNHAKCNTFTTVDIAGPLNGWSGGDTLTAIGNNIYEITVMVDSGEVEFKFRDITSGTNWEGAANRIFVLSQNDTGEFCYNVNGQGFCTPIPDEADITFRVDFSQAGVTPAADIWLIGDFTGWQANAIKMDPVLTSPGLYETTIQDFCPGSLFYKFVNGDLSNTANEENSGLNASCAVPNGLGGFNRFFERTNNNPVVLQYVFNTCTLLTIGVEENEMSNISVYPNPMRDHMTVTVGEGNHTIMIMDLTGRTVRHIGNASEQVVIERGTLTSGMYILNVVNSKGTSRTHKFIVE